MGRTRGACTESFHVVINAVGTAKPGQWWRAHLEEVGVLLWSNQSVLSEKAKDLAL